MLSPFFTVILPKRRALSRLCELEKPEKGTSLRPGVKTLTGPCSFVVRPKPSVQDRSLSTQTQVMALHRFTILKWVTGRLPLLSGNDLSLYAGLTMRSSEQRLALRSLLYSELYFASLCR